MAGKIIRSKKTADFVILGTHCLRNKHVSWQAKGLHSYVMQLPDDWQLNIADLENRSTNGRDSTANAMKELITFGYVTRVRVNGEKGKFEGYDYTVFEYPNEEAMNALAVNGFSVNGLSVDGKPVTNKNEYLPNYEDNLNQSISASAKEKIETVEDIQEDTKEHVQEGIKEAVNLTLEEEKEKTPPCSAPPPSFTEGMPKTWKDLVRDAEPREIKYDKFTGERLFMIDTAAELAEALFKIKDHKIFCDNVRQAAQREANERIGDIFTEYLRRQLSITWDSIQVQKQLETHILNYARKYPFVEKRNQQLATELAEANKESKVKDISAADKWRKVVNEAA